MKSLLTQILSLLLASSIAAHAAGNDWMSCLDGDLPISQLSIPGTHDSGALVEPFPGTARTQDLTIDLQLALGVRFLDIRCRHENDQFNIYHGIIPQVINFDVVLLSVNTFLDANPSEAVIMSIKEENTPQNNTRSFEATFDFYVAQNPTRWMLSDHTPTLGEARNQIVLFRRFGANSTPKGINASSFPDNTDFTTDNRLRVQDRYVVTDNDDKWKAIHSLLGEAKHGGPNTLYVNFCSGYQEIEFGVPNITSVSDDINVRLADYFTQNTSGQFGAILMDFADANKIELIYQTNLEDTNAVHRPAFFTIVNRNSGKAIDLIAGSNNNGAQINQWNHDAGQNQRWALAPSTDGNHFRITSWHSSRCFNIQNNSTSPGAKLLSFQHNNGDNPSQHFDLIDAGDGFFKIRNVKSNLILEVQNSGTGDNARIQQNTDTGAANQQWRLQPWGNYFARTSSEDYLATDGSAIEQQAWQEHPSNEWSFESSSNGYLKAKPITNPAKSISIPGSDNSSGVAAESLVTGGQDLRIEPKTDGSFKFYFVHSGLAWEGTNGDLQQNTTAATAEQTFQLERPSSFTTTLPNAEHDWRCDHFALADIFDPTKEATLWGRDANPDGDEWNNFEEFAFGGDPNDDKSTLDNVLTWTYDTTSDKFIATFPRLQGELLVYQLQFSNDLQTWSAATATETSSDLADKRYETASFTETTPTASTRRRFVTIQVSDPASADPPTQLTGATYGYYHFLPPAGSSTWTCGLVKSRTHAGIIDSISGATLTETGAAFAIGALVDSYVEILAPSEHAGATFDVVSNTADTVTVASDLTAYGLSGDENFAVRKHVTLGEMLPGGAGLQPPSDSLTLHSPDGSSKTFLLVDLGGGDLNWFLPPSTLANDTIVRPSQGFIIQAAAQRDLLIGQVDVACVKTTATISAVHAGATNLVGLINPLVSEDAGTPSTIQLKYTGLLKTLAPSTPTTFSNESVTLFGRAGGQLSSTGTFFTFDTGGGPFFYVPPSSNADSQPVDIGSAFSIEVETDKIYRQELQIPSP